MARKILIQTSSPFASNNAIFERDTNNMTEPWRVLKMRLNAIGYEVMTADENPIEECEWILFIDALSIYGTYQQMGFKNHIKKLLKKISGKKEKNPWPNRPLYEEAINKGMRKKMALFLWEGAVVSPYNYRPNLWKKFDLIFTWRDDLIDNKKFFKFYLPTPRWPKPPKLLSFEEKKLLVNISANKWYTGPTELFTKRVKTSKYFDTHYPNDFDLYGARWHTAITRWQRWFPALIPRFNTYRGPAKDKMETISRYKFALCYENVANNQGYVTEKIFDIIQAGSVPIYWGAPNIEKYVDPKSFVDRRKFKDDAELAKYLTGITKDEYQNMQDAGQAYLKTELCDKFFPEYFAQRVIEVLNLKPHEKQ